jgi:hypothetical protein
MKKIIRITLCTHLDQAAKLCIRMVYVTYFSFNWWFQDHLHAHHQNLPNNQILDYFLLIK